MRRTLARLLAQAEATGASGGGIGGRPPTDPRRLLALLPPIPLYRRLLRANRRSLPPQLRLLGDQYIRAEFRAHRKAENPAHIIGFLTEWQLYAQRLEGGDWKGERIDPGKVEKMSDQQMGQLYELMKAIKIRDPESEGDQGGP